MSSNHDHIKNDPRWHAARAECFERDDWTCRECGATEDLQADHVVPLAVLFAEGVTPEALDLALDVDNLVTLCGGCNNRKSDRLDGPIERHAWVHPDYAADLADLVLDVVEPSAGADEPTEAESAGPIF